ncbi:MAG: YicC/YloC family endoribonuclease [Pseudomonadota bacterium]
MAGAVHSMTGFGAAHGDAEWGSWSVEAKSVNGRSLDVRVNTPPGFDSLEPVAKTAASARLSRGNIQIAVRIEPSTPDIGSSVNGPLLDSLIETVQARLATRHKARPTWIATLMTIRGVVEPASNDLRALASSETVVRTLKNGIVAALDQLVAARSLEGQSQVKLFRDLLGNFQATAKSATDAAAEQPAKLKARLETQLAELGAADKVDGERLATEVALSAAKADVREELDRLDAHFNTAQSLLEQGSPIGRKLDFLSQEIGREANTLCSKSASIELTNAGLTLKALNDQFKEQAANVE